MRTLLTALLLSIILIPIADAQQRVMRERQQPQPTGPNQALATADLPGHGGATCSYTRVTMLRDGLMLFCRERDSSPWNDFYVVFDGGSRPGGISATMSLITTYQAHYREDPSNPPRFSVTYRDPRPSAQALCDVLGSDAETPCYEALSFTYP